MVESSLIGARLPRVVTPEKMLQAMEKGLDADSRGQRRPRLRLFQVAYDGRFRRRGSRR